MNNVYVHFVSAQPHSRELSGGKNDLFSPLFLNEKNFVKTTIVHE